MARRNKDQFDPFADASSGSESNQFSGVDEAEFVEAPLRPRRKKHPVRRVILGISFGLVVLLVAGGGYAFFNYQRFVGGVTHVDAITPPAEGEEDFDGEAQNILLVGDDHRPDGATDEQLAQIGTEADGGGTSTDTMIVLHIPADGSTATMVSFPRDSWVDIPGYGKNKLNAAFSLGSAEGGDAGGARLLIESIENLSGLTIDHYVRVSLLGFYNVVDALGPVDVCLNNAVKDPYSTIDLPAGVSTLNAQQALAFVRQRHGLPNGDLDRQVRQQYFLSVEARKVLSAGTLLNPIKLGRVLDAVSSSVETDPGLNFINLARQLQGLGADNITSATIPILGTPTIYVGGSPLSIVEVDSSAIPGFFASLIGPPEAYTDAVAAAPAEVNLLVTNGSGVSGAAGALSASFNEFGFVTAEPESTDYTATTFIQYPEGQEAAAKAVSAYLPGATVTLSSDVSSVTVVIGANGASLVDPAAAPVVPDPAVEAPVEEEAPVEGAPRSYAEGACIN
ncbi:MAG TPA: LCP family protein [Glaciihabitans sp.]|nr:LCP family protein [Glaciihabitans sp.]